MLCTKALKNENICKQNEQSCRTDKKNKSKPAKNARTFCDICLTFGKANYTDCMWSDIIIQHM